MSLPVAYCVQLNALVDIAEAMDFYFSQEPPRQDLRFLCPDSICRDELGSPIIAVNYKKVPGLDVFVQRPHFKIDGHYAHHADCPWSEIAMAIEQADARVSGKPHGFKQFNPANSDGESGDWQIPDDAVKRIKKLPGKADRVNAYKEYFVQIQRSTSRLCNVVKIYKDMNANERKTTPFRIGTYPVKTYFNYFLPARYCSPVEFYPKIYHGTANVKKWKSGYSIRFKEKTKQPDGVWCSASVFLSSARLDAFTGRAFLLATLEAAAEIGGDAMECYVFGSAERSPEHHGCLDIHLESLHSIVLMLIDQG